MQDPIEQESKQEHLNWIVIAPIPHIDSYPPDDENQRAITEVMARWAP